MTLSYGEGSVIFGPGTPFVSPGWTDSVLLREGDEGCPSKVRGV